MKHLDRLQLAQQEFEAYQRELPLAATALQQLLTKGQAHWEKLAQPVAGVGRVVRLNDSLHILATDAGGLCLAELAGEHARQLTSLEAVDRYSLPTLIEIFDLAAERLTTHYRTRRQANAEASSQAITR